MSFKNFSTTQDASHKDKPAAMPEAEAAKDQPAPAPRAAPASAKPSADPASKS